MEASKAVLHLITKVVREANEVGRGERGIKRSRDEKEETSTR